MYSDEPMQESTKITASSQTLIVAAKDFLDKEYGRNGFQIIQKSIMPMENLYMIEDKY